MGSEENYKRFMEGQDAKDAQADEEFQEDTKRFYKWFEENDVVFVISDLLDIEFRQYYNK